MKTSASAPSGPYAETCRPGNLAENIEQHWILPRGELLLGDNIGGDGCLLGSSFVAARGDHDSLERTGDRQSDLALGRRGKVGVMRLEAGLLHANAALVDTGYGKPALRVAVDRLILARDSSRFHRAAGRIQNSSVNVVSFARAEPERQSQ